MDQITHKRGQIVERLQQDIVEKELRSGDRIGSIRQLAMRYHVAPLTISRMLEELIGKDYLYRDRRGCFCLKHDPPQKLYLGYAGIPIIPGNMNCLLSDATAKLFAELEKQNAPPQIISYHECCDLALTRRRLADLNGLLVHECFVDKQTVKIWDNLNIPVVRIGQSDLREEFNCSEVVQNLTPALNEFAEYCDWDFYDRIICLRATHGNAIMDHLHVEKMLKKFKQTHKQQTIDIPCYTHEQAELAAFYDFMERARQDWSKTLIIAGSGYFARGIVRALRQYGELPDILCIDNLDGHEKNPLFNEPYFTAIERNMTEIFQEAASLLCDLVRRRDHKIFYLKVPASLVVRKSIKHTRKH